MLTPMFYRHSYCKQYQYWWLHEHGVKHELNMTGERRKSSYLAQNPLHCVLSLRDAERRSSSPTHPIKGV